MNTSLGILDIIGYKKIPRAACSSAAGGVRGKRVMGEESSNRCSPANLKVVRNRSRVEVQALKASFIACGSVIGTD